MTAARQGDQVGWGREPALAGAGAEVCAKTDEIREEQIQATGVTGGERGHGLSPGSREPEHLRSVHVANLVARLMSRCVRHHKKSVFISC